MLGNFLHSDSAGGLIIYAATRRSHWVISKQELEVLDRE